MISIWRLNLWRNSGAFGIWLSHEVLDFAPAHLAGVQRLQRAAFHPGFAWGQRVGTATLWGRHHFSYLSPVLQYGRGGDFAAGAGLGPLAAGPVLLHDAACFAAAAISGAGVRPAAAGCRPGADRCAEFRRAAPTRRSGQRTAIGDRRRLPLDAAPALHRQHAGAMAAAQPVDELVRVHPGDQLVFHHWRNLRRAQAGGFLWTDLPRL